MNKHIRFDGLQATSDHLTSDRAITMDQEIVSTIADRRLARAKITAGLGAREEFDTGALWEEYRVSGDCLAELRPATAGGAIAMLDEIDFLFRMEGIADKVEGAMDKATSAIVGMSSVVQGAPGRGRHRIHVAFELDACVSALGDIEDLVRRELNHDPSEHDLSLVIVRSVRTFVSEKLGPAATARGRLPDPPDAEPLPDFLSVLRETQAAWYRFNTNGSEAEDVDDPDWQHAQRMEKKLADLRPQNWEDAIAGLQAVLTTFEEHYDPTSIDARFASRVVGFATALLAKHGRGERSAMEHPRPTRDEEDLVVVGVRAWRRHRAQQLLNWAAENLSERSQDCDLSPLRSMRDIEHTLAGLEPTTTEGASMMLDAALQVLALRQITPDATMAEGPVLELLRNVKMALDFGPNTSLGAAVDEAA